MVYDDLNARRFLRNRFAHITETGDLLFVSRFDECTLSLRELCLELLTDRKPFPWHLNWTIRRLCGHEDRIWFREKRTYGNAAALLLALLDVTADASLPARGMWVADALRSRATMAANSSITNPDKD